ncbi:DUF4224 domain-containing protein [Ralstonia solanacearum]|uniref:DUF4224 domain-containing protein n=1 Tax=Ralstonia phage RsoM1USA TaxID=2991867 RepID=A0A9W3URD9_9CAUD|nr:DUF4224 domain-containing protein [Ralstonia solanacearum]YP_009880136.1 DUF4224 domain-containing protein [Ralstonia phage RsoM1USA]AVP40045.1 DUF4224 domain-containing protein [Ralstonia phage RsoM1USA]
MDYLDREQLRELVGSPQRARQIAWLSREGWPFVVNSKGRVLVSRAYHARRLGIAPQATASASKPGRTPINLDAL